jgi:nitrogen fixation protein NifZ
MAEARDPKFQWGQPVITTADLVNDGSYPDAPLDALLENLGAQGEIVNIGVVEETGAPIYLVEFPDGKVIGVFEEEISLV